MIYIILILGILGTLFIIPYFNDLLIDNNIVRKNYKGETIPVSIGIVFLPMIIINSTIIMYHTRDSRIYVYLLGICAMAFIGIVDDLIGDREVSGLKGHFKSLLKGKLTTGGFKALFGGLVALLISVSITSNIVDIIINTLIIALFTNFINLLDLRPGRAIKGYISISIVMMISISEYFSKLLLVLVVSNVLGYFNWDLKARSMMGDAGSNLLGISLGIICTMNYDFKIRLLILTSLILIHIITEKFSLTKIIENNKLLNYIDKLGR